MLRKTEPKFKVGDVVDLRAIWGGSFATPCPPEDHMGVIVLINSKSKRKWDYQVYWFSEDSYLLFEDDLMPCIGLEKKWLCRKCEDKDLCRHLPAIVRCDISEFGRLRGEERKTENCDKCKNNRTLCYTKRWLTSNPIQT